MTSKKDGCSLTQNHQASSSKKKGTIGIEVSTKKDNAKGHNVDGEVNNEGDHNHKKNFKKGPWTAEEDALLMEYVKTHGERHWNSVQKTGLMRCGKSCRLRWTNHLRPDLKKGAFSPEEERIVLDLHAKLGNKWSKIAVELPGRTDNEVKNFWNTKIKRRMKANQLIMLSSQGNQPNQAMAFHHHFQQQKNQNVQERQELPSIPVSINSSHSSMASFLATTNSSPMSPSIVKPQHLGKSGDNQIRSNQFNDPILSFLNNPAYKYQFLSEEEKGNYNSGKNFLLSYSPLPRFDLSQHSSVSNTLIAGNSHPHSISFDIGSTNSTFVGSPLGPLESTCVKTEQPSSQINYQQMPMTSSFGMLGVECGMNDSWLSSYMGNNSEVEKSSITDEEKCVFEGTTRGGKEMGNKRLLVNHHNSSYNNGTKKLKMEPLEEFLPMDDDLSTLLHDFSSIGSPTHLYYASNEASMPNHNKEAFEMPLGATMTSESLSTTIAPSTTSTLEFNYNMDDCYWTNPNENPLKC